MWIYILISYALAATLVAVVGLIAVFRLRQRQKSLQQQDQMYHIKQLLSSLQAATVITDAEGLVTFANDKFLSNSGYALDELLHKHISMLKGSTDTDLIANDLWLSINNGQVWRGPFMNLTKDGRPYTEEFLIFPLRDSANRLFFCAIGHTVANRYLEKREIEQVQRQSMHFKENFINNLSHEVRTPLNALVGLSQLGAKCEDLSKSQSYFSKINVSSKQLMQLMDDILDFSRIESGSFNLVKNRFNFMSLLTALTSQYGPMAADKALEFNFLADETLPQYLYADSFRLEQIISNLLSNAIKFTDSGEIQLRIALKPAQPDGWHLTFNVTDTGIGMDQHQLKGLFNPFAKLVEDDQKRSNNSSGMGMAITKQIVDLMGGSIYIDSKPHEGTSIEVTLPFSQEDLEMPKPHVKSSSESFKVMVIDDAQVSRDNAERMLLTFGYEVRTMASGQAALDELRRDPQIDLVLLDWNMPDMGGEETLVKVISLLPEPPRILYMTPFGVYSVPEPLRRYIHGYLPKPFTEPMLFDEIMSVFMSQPPITKTAQLGDGPLSGCDLLLVDDNPVNNMIAKSMFEHAGARVTVFQSAIKALEHLAKHSYQLIISDINMPEMDGFDFFKALRKAQIQTPVFALTASAGDDVRQQIHNAGFEGYFTKPLTQKKMNDLASHFAHSDRVAAAIAAKPPTLGVVEAAVSALHETCSKAETEQFLHAARALYAEAKLRRPKVCRELISQLKSQSVQSPELQAFLDQLQAELSRYRFDQILHLLESLIQQMGGETLYDDPGNG